jgi:hypothetical protein
MNIDSILARTHRETPLADVDGDCRVWEGAVQSSGYGSLTDGHGGTALAHRVIYEATVGPISDAMTIDHLCFRKLCLNVHHMEVVTRGENTRRMLAALTHCKQGHPLAGANVRRIRRRDGYTRRVCVTCARAATRESMRRLRAAA